MNCSNCTGNKFLWRGEILANGGEPHALIDIECWLCGRTYQAAVPWERFDLVQEGSKKPVPRWKKEEERLSKEERAELLKEFKEKFAAKWPGVNGIDPKEEAGDE